jgi:hypothetical protein
MAIKNNTIIYSVLFLKYMLHQLYGIYSLLVNKILGIAT